MNLTQNQKLKIKDLLPPWLDILAIITWGILLLKYWLTGELRILIHPDYAWLVIVTGIIFLLLGAVKAGELIWRMRQRNYVREQSEASAHITLFPPMWSSGLLLVTAIVGLMIAPKIFTSQTAIARGITDSITMTRAKPQQFRASINSEERSLVEWVRTLNVYPEPDAYTGEKVKVQGFVVYPTQPPLPEQYLLLSRFVITCCAADAYPVGIPVKLPAKRADLPADTWLEIQGKMITETLDGKRQLVIESSVINKISPPANPYDY